MASVSGLCIAFVNSYTIMSGIQASYLGIMYAPAACASAGVCTLLVDWAELTLMFSIDSLYSLSVASYS